MYKYNIAIEGEENFTMKEVQNLLKDNITDGVICIRRHDGGSSILKGKVKINIVKNSEQLVYKENN
ncbi:MULTISPECIES: hypothetical protein [Mammaliicoccus]|uniref:hypothetical protein n=1 Tax=Mammaliicoccus TaxID=2803850 RepID=UPI001EFAB39E|nr:MULTISPECIES: hypothetical protein [Mammaliicoccus]UXU70081.1 hypothetical protein MUA36_05215 [Mammaliicoccus sciuri]WQL34196.1 hypothetical protein P3U41_05355 [Mammaliicoccus sciuri]WQL61135.1 hypothetical protein P3T96_05355 [Mammaliicoccus sciuri]